MDVALTTVRSFMEEKIQFNVLIVEKRTFKLTVVFMAQVDNQNDDNDYDDKYK